MRVSVLLCVAISSLLVIEVSSAELQVQRAFPNLKFTHPVDLQNAGDGTDRIFVVDLEGIIHVFPNDPNVTSSSVFLDIQDRVDFGEGEQGLWGLAFHPDYEHNGYFYVRYSADNFHSVVSRFKVSDADPNIAEPDSEVILLNLPQDALQHYGGQLAFGPSDGYLYISTGDGSLGGDPFCNAQNLQSLRGKVLRIDVDHPANGNQYGIPPENPFVGNTQGYLEEIYAYGFRNPWRFSIDPVTDSLWLGDVGSASWEEVDIVEAGKNYGWSIMEGAHCANSPHACTPPCTTPGLQLPIWEFDHNTGQAVMGGYVYRGPSVPELVGKYIYADLATGSFWSLEYGTPTINTLLFVAQLEPVAFGVDQNNELYVCAFQPDSTIYRFAHAFVDQPPVVSDIPDQTVPRGASFAPFGSDNYVTDPDQPDSLLTWTWSGNTKLSLMWTPNRRRFRIRAPHNWTGSETITFTATDPYGLSDSDDATFTVTASEGANLAAAPSPDLTGKPETAFLDRNYPNPFNPSTIIRYGLNEDSWVTLKVYNTLGQEIATLVDQLQTAGYKSVTWKATNAAGGDVAAGVYIYTLRAGGIVESGKMIVAK